MISLEVLYYNYNYIANYVLFFLYTAVSAMLFNSSATPSLNDGLQFPQKDDLLNFANSSTVPAEIEIPAELLTERLSQLNGEHV